MSENNGVVLEPCPFCGSDEVSMSFSATLQSPDPAARFVECEKCAASGPNYDIGTNDSDLRAKAFATAAWNTRALAHQSTDLDQWQPIETHGGHCSPVLVCRETPTETVRATSAFLDVTGVWRLFGSRAGAARLRFKPTHWRPLPSPPQPQGEGE